MKTEICYIHYEHLKKIFFSNNPANLRKIILILLIF